MEAVDKFAQEKETLEQIVKLNKTAIEETGQDYINNSNQKGYGIDKLYEFIKNNIIQKTYNAKDAQELLDYAINTYIIPDEKLFSDYNFMKAFKKSSHGEGVIPFFVSYIINNVKEQEITIDAHDKKLDYLGYKANNKTLIINSKNYGDYVAMSAENSNIIFNEDNLKSNIAINTKNCTIIFNKKESNFDYFSNSKNCNAIYNQFSEETAEKFKNIKFYRFSKSEILENGMKMVLDGGNNRYLIKIKKNDKKKAISQIINIKNQLFLAEKDRIVLVNELQAIEALRSKDDLSELEKNLMENVIGAKENTCPACKEERPKISGKYINFCEKCGHEYEIKIIQNMENDMDEESEIME